LSRRKLFLGHKPRGNFSGYERVEKPGEKALEEDESIADHKILEKR